ncbi:MAG TPA: LUD domain-containing protein [Patescibacteria group bacterium]|nr:LUD domain-containing protein [Patescibacteria group bacterium]
MTNFNKLAPDALLDKTVKNLKVNGIESFVFENTDEAKKKLFKLIPENSEVMTMSSETLRLSGITKEINESGKYNSVKNELNKMNRETDSLKMQKLGSAPEYCLGSVHAVTSDGHVFIASNTGSQLSAYVYGASHVIWVIGTQKIVKDDKDAIARIYDYILPKESVRLAEQYGNPEIKSNVSKILIVNKEFNPDRVKILFVKEEIGF